MLDKAIVVWLSLTSMSFTKRWVNLMAGVFKHYMNPLHIYCRLRDLGLKKGAAGFLCQMYERRIFNRFILLRQ